MRCLFVIGFVSLLTMILDCTPSRAADHAASLDEPAPSLPINDWLFQGERKAFACEIHIAKPALTFQQRHRVWVTAKLPAPSLQKGSIQRDLYFFVKVADENGRWFDGQTYNHFRIDKKFDKKVDIVLEAGLYLQPGSFTVAVIVYDAVLREHNVSFRQVRVKPPKHDSLPSLLSALPRVEFPPDSIDGVAALGSGHASLPLMTERPVELDVVVDISPYVRPRYMAELFDVDATSRSSMSASNGAASRSPSSLAPLSRSLGAPPQSPAGRMRSLLPGVRRNMKGYQSRLLEAASVLSDIDPKNGCTRVTVFNALSRHTLMTAEASTSADWQKTWEEVLNTDLNVISVEELAGTADAAKYFHDQMERLMMQAPHCNVKTGRPVRVLTLLSRGAHFQYGSVQPKIQSKCDCRVFYLHEHEDVMDMFDDLQHMLTPLSVTRLEFSDPLQFRRKLAHLVKAVQQIASDK